MKLKTLLIKFPKLFSNSLFSLICKSAHVNNVSDAWFMQTMGIFNHPQTERNQRNLTGNKVRKTAYQIDSIHLWPIS